MELLLFFFFFRFLRDLHAVFHNDGTSISASCPCGLPVLRTLMSACYFLSSRRPFWQVWVVSHQGLTCLSAMISEVARLLMCLLAICASWGKVLLQVLCPGFNRVVLFCFSCMSSLHIWDTNPLLGMSWANAGFSSVGAFLRCWWCLCCTFQFGVIPFLYFFFCLRRHIKNI